jgi:hypothetical protein
MTEGKQTQIRETIQSQAEQLVGLQQDIAEWLKLHTQMEEIWRQIEGLRDERQVLVDRRDDIETRLEELEPIANRETEDSLDVLRERTMAALLQLDGLLPRASERGQRGVRPALPSGQAPQPESTGPASGVQSVPAQSESTGPASGVQSVPAQPESTGPASGAQSVPAQPETDVEVLPPEDDDEVPAWIKDNLNEKEDAGGRGGGILGKLGNGAGSFLSL